MEISAAGRLEVRITAADVGKRVSVRCLTEGGVPGGKFTDTVGVLTSWDDDVLVITRKGGESVRVDASSLVAGKVVPPAPARRRGPAAGYEELAQVASRAWRPLESARLGGWELRASAGFTRRANSVLPLGAPGVPLDAALDFVRQWYGARGLPAYVQTATGAEGTQELLCAELEVRGWEREVTAELWVGALAPLADRAEAEEVVLAREADEAWLARYQRKGVSEVALKVLGGGSPRSGEAESGGGPSVWFASVPGGSGGAPAAIGRCVVDGRWAGFAAVEVDPARRRQGLAGLVMAALARRALAEGASAAWLQVEEDNAAARALYTGLGFTAHHAYHHYREPAPGSPPRSTSGSASRSSPETAPEAAAPTSPGATAGPVSEPSPEAPAPPSPGASPVSASEPSPEVSSEAGSERSPGDSRADSTQASSEPSSGPSRESSAGTSTEVA